MNKISNIILFTKKINTYLHLWKYYQIINVLQENRFDIPANNLIL